MLYSNHVYETEPKVSIVISLDRNRGIVRQCIEGWYQQSISRFGVAELVLVGSSNFNDEDTVFIKQFLLPSDQIIFVESTHDIGQIKAGAKKARGEWLFFTESHCIPFPDSLKMLFEAIEAHPDWDGFSGDGVPLIKNRLSKTEAQLYKENYKRALNEIHWRKVINQCFVIRKKSYFAAGEYSEEYGQFAEWLFSAQLHQAGFVIGFEPKFKIQHKYCGSIKETEVFTRDFCAGEMRYQMNRTHLLDEQLDEQYFPALYEWNIRQNLDMRSYKKMLHFSCCTLKWQLFLFSLSRLFLYGQWSLLKKRFFIYLSRYKLLWGSLFFTDATLLKCYQSHLTKVIHYERLKFIFDEVNAINFPKENLWKAYSVENNLGQTFRWFPPIGVLSYKLKPGKYQLKINILPWVSSQHLQKICFFMNGGQLKFRWDKLQKSLLVEFEAVRDFVRTEIGFIFPEIKPISSQEKRKLGLPVTDVQIINLTNELYET